ARPSDPSVAPRPSTTCQRPASPAQRRLNVRVDRAFAGQADAIDADPSARNRPGVPSQAAASSFNCSTIGPSASAGQYSSDTTMTTVPTIAAPNVSDAVGSVPRDMGRTGWLARSLANARASTASPSRPASMATRVVAFQNGELTAMLLKAWPLLANDEA